jgi:2-methylcitrate dehydratase
VFDLHGKLERYKGKFDALISAHYTAAVILHDRQLTLAQYEPDRYDDPKLRRAAVEQVEVRPNPALSGIQSAVEIEMDDGAMHSGRCDHPRGSYENPLTRQQIEGKFRTYAKGVLADTDVEEVIDAVNRLEDCASVRRLMDLLRASPQARGERAA